MVPFINMTPKLLDSVLLERDPSHPLLPEDTWPPFPDLTPVPGLAMVWIKG